jgi:flagellar biosynthesis/type III secretory pathway M-ring protein FliF/YscJ
MEFNKIISQLKEALGTMSSRQMIVAGGTIAVLLFFLFLVSLISGSSGRDSYQVLFDSLSPRNADRVVEQLKKDGVPFRIVNEHTIEVPHERIYEERKAFASLDIPEEGWVGFERPDAQTFGRKEKALFGTGGETLGGSAGDSAFGELSSMEQRFKQHEEHKREEKIVNVLSPILGGRKYVVAKVTIEYDFSQKQSTSEIYNPKGIVRSEQQSETADRDATVTAGTDAPARRLQSSRATTYEHSKTMTTTRENHARIKRITAAVVIDENAPLDDEEEKLLAEMTTLVKRSIGIDEKRGDLVSVRYFRFLKPQTEALSPSILPQRERSGLVALVEPYTPLLKLLLVVLIAWVLLQAVLRPLLKSGGKPQTGSGEKIRPSDPVSAAAQTRKEQVVAERTSGAEALLSKVRSAAANSPKEVAALLQALMEEEKRSGKAQRIKTWRRGG